MNEFIEKIQSFVNDPHLIYINRSDKYIVFSLVRSRDNEVVLTFNLHRVEAKKFSAQIIKVIEGDRYYSAIEGANLGAAPGSEQVLG